MALRKPLLIAARRRQYFRAAPAEQFAREVADESGVETSAREVADESGAASGYRETGEG